MGNKVPKLTEEQLEDLQDCTYFTRKEILRIQQKFVELDPQNIPQVSFVDSFILGKLISGLIFFCLILLSVE